MTHDTRTVGCNPGYATDGAASAVSECVGTAPGVSEWTLVTCDVVQCPPLTVAVSDTTSHIAYTTDTHEVTCDPNEGDFGYGSWDGLSFTATCSPLEPTTVEWTNVLECYPLDCAGTPQGTLVLDLCGVCDGDDTTCMDCAGVPNGPLFLDECGVCGGDGSSCVIVTVGSSIGQTSNFFQASGSREVLSLALLATLAAMA
jgi:hypothetical protein